MFTSQPSRATFSTLQLAKPAVQLMLQAPPMQLGEPLTVLQAWAQPPQLFTSLLVGVSQPSRAMFSSAEQSLYPELQTTLHSPPEQVDAPFTELQAALQAPQ